MPEFVPKTYEERYKSNEGYKQWFYEHVEVLRRGANIDPSIKIILGGSRINNLAYEQSDIDFYIVSDDVVLREKTFFNIQKFYMKMIKNPHRIMTKMIHHIPSIYVTKLIQPFHGVTQREAQASLEFHVPNDILVCSLDILFMSNDFYELMTSEIQRVIREEYNTDRKKLIT